MSSPLPLPPEQLRVLRRIVVAAAWIVTCLMLACAALIGITIVFVVPIIVIVFVVLGLRLLHKVFKGHYVFFNLRLPGGINFRQELTRPEG